MARHCIRIIVADDHSVVRDGLRAMIGGQPDMQIVAECRDWPQTIRIILRHRPDVAIADLHMPEGEGPAAISAIRARISDAKIIVFSAFDADEEVFQSIRAGACGYLLKGEADSEDLLRCIRGALAGQVWIDPSAAARLAQRMKERVLTDREKHILQLMVAGKSNKEIGNSINVTEGTVKVHLNHVFAKLGVGSRVAAVAVAVQRGLAKLAAPASGPLARSADEKSKQTAP